jgi:hypothetical protein
MLGGQEVDFGGFVANSAKLELYLITTSYLHSYGLA